ncbi:MAG TPA: hypothetical protein VJR05_03430 [Acidimicrobiia bacterium]|nr:hypothetical protein [Acidimicrobiia bacterium]
MLPRLIASTLGIVLAGLGLAKLLLRSRIAPHLDEIDVAVVAGRRRLRPGGGPFLGATVLVVAGTAELDLRQVAPAPTGVEVAVTLIAARLHLVLPPDWTVVPSIQGTWAPLKDGAPDGGDDRVRVWLHGRAWLSRIYVRRDPAPPAVA